MIKILAILATTMLVLPAADQAGQGHEKGRHCGEFRQKLLAQFDADKDGKLSDTEKAAAKEACKQRFAEKKAQFDSDGDGKLNDAERAAARAAVAAKLQEKHPEAFARIDSDDDGSLSQSEAQAARKARRERRGQRHGAGD